MKRRLLLCLLATAATCARAADPQPKTAEEILRIVRLSYALQNHKMTGVLRDDATGRTEPLQLNREKQVLRFLFTNPGQVNHPDLKSEPASA